MILWGMTRKTYRPWAPNQAYLLPPTPLEWLPEGHLAYFILDVVGELDLSGVEDVLQAKDPRGQRSYDPQMMVALLLYAYSVGVFSSRRIASGTYGDVAMRFISGDQHPHFTRLAAFRREHLAALGGLFTQVVQLCAHAGLVKLGHVSIDGTKVRANASKHKAMSYDRMVKDEERIQNDVGELLQRAEDVDASEDAEFGEEHDGVDIPDELRRRESRLARIRQAKTELEAEARDARASRLRELANDNDQRAEAEDEPQKRKAAATRASRQRQEADVLSPLNDSSAEDDEPPESQLPRHRPRTETDGTPKPKAQRNFTDPDSRIMVEGSGAFAQAYNAQAAVTDETQIIVACPLSNQAPDAEYLVPVIAEVRRVTGSLPEKITADAGYWSPRNAAWCEEQEVDAYISPRRVRRRRSLPGEKAKEEPAPKREPTPKEKMQAKVTTKEGREIYRRRKFIPEPVFGQIKEARGFRRFLLRGLSSVRLEWSLVCATHNLLKLFRATEDGRWTAAEG